MHVLILSPEAVMLYTVGQSFRIKNTGLFQRYRMTSHRKGPLLQSLGPNNIHDLYITFTRLCSWARWLTLWFVDLLVQTASGNHSQSWPKKYMKQHIGMRISCLGLTAYMHMEKSEFHTIQDENLKILFAKSNIQYVCLHHLNNYYISPNASPNYGLLTWAQKLLGLHVHCNTSESVVLVLFCKGNLFTWLWVYNNVVI